MKIGIPRALLWHKYGRLWETFISELGHEVAISNPGTRETFESGCAHCLDEICLPIKSYYGHVLELKGRVDAIFIPKVISVERRRPLKSFTCPKIIGLADMIKASIPGLPEIISPRIDVNGEAELLSFFKLGMRLNPNPVRVLRAYMKAVKAQRDHDARSRQSERLSGPKIGLISHSYNLCGAYPTPDVVRILRKLGAVPVTVDIYEREELLSSADGQFPELSWNYEREMLGGALRMFNDEDMAGGIVISNFSCGPDSLIGDYITRMARRHSSIPFTLLTIDEHTAEAGLVTRIEAFLDMIEMRK